MWRRGWERLCFHFVPSCTVWIFFQYRSLFFAVSPGVIHEERFCASLFVLVCVKRKLSHPPPGRVTSCLRVLWLLTADFCISSSRPTHLSWLLSLPPLSLLPFLSLLPPFISTPSPAGEKVTQCLPARSTPAHLVTDTPVLRGPFQGAFSYWKVVPFPRSTSCLPQMTYFPLLQTNDSYQSLHTYLTPFVKSGLDQHGFYLHGHFINWLLSPQLQNSS